MVLRAGVVGVGHLGRHHARIYNRIPGVRLNAVSDTDPRRRFEVAIKEGAWCFADYKDMIGRVDLVSIVVPTSYHLAVARPFIEAGVHVLVEKPLAPNVEDARALCDLAAKHKTVLQVGHIERFNPALRAAAKVVHDPRYIISDRIAPYTFRSSDIGVVLDLMVHDLDLVLQLVNSSVDRVEAIGLPVMSQGEDIADARLRFSNGAQADLRASRVSFASRARRMRIFQANAYVSIDFDDRKVWVFRKKNNASFEARSVDPHLIKNAQDLIKSQFIDVEEHAMTDPADALSMELSSFVGACRGEHPPLVTGEHGLHAVTVARAIQGEIQAYLLRETERSGLFVPDFVRDARFGEVDATSTYKAAGDGPKTP